VAFDKIPERVRNLASNGEEIMFCQRGGVLRSAAQAIVNYSISCFHLCNHTCKEIRGCVSNYRYLHASFSSCKSSNGGKIGKEYHGHCARPHGWLMVSCLLELWGHAMDMRERAEVLNYVRLFS
jgi:hypothetical protein